MANVLTLRAEFDARSANQSIGGLNNNLGGIDKAALKGSQGATRALQGIDKTAVSVSASIKRSFSGLGAALGIAGIGALAKSTFDLVAGFERSRVGLKAFLGDAKSADALFKDIQAFAEKSPFEFKDLLTGSQRLLAFKTEAKDIVPTLKAISATIGATGGDQGNFDSLIKALGDIRNRGKVTGEEIRQLTNQGVPAIDLLAKGFGKTTAEISKAVSDGIVPADAAIRVLVQGMTDKFGKFDDEVSKTASVAVSNFKDTVQRLADDVAKDYLPSITTAINDVRTKLGELSSWIKENKSTLTGLATLFAEIGAAIVVYKVVAGLEGIAIALSAIRAASLANPWALIAAGIAFVGIETYKANAAMAEFRDNKLDDSMVSGLLQQGKTAKEIEDLGIKAGITADRIQSALNRIKGDSDFSGFAKGLSDKYGFKIQGEAAAAAVPKIERLDTTLRDAEEAAKNAADANKRSADILDRARRGELSGVARIVEEYRQYREELGITAVARKNLSEAQGIALKGEILDFSRKANAEEIKGIEAEREIRLAADADVFQNRLKIEADTRDLRFTNARDEFALQEQVLTARRDRELRGLEGIQAVSVDQKIAVEQEKATIELQYLQQSLEVKKVLLSADQAIEIAQAGQNAELKLAIEQKYALARKQLEGATQAEVDAIKENSVNRSNQIIIDNNQRTFDQYKSQAESAIDAAIGVFQNGWKSMGNFLKATLLGAMKDVLSSQVARMLFGLTGGSGGGSPAAAGGGGGGIFGTLLGLGGSAQAFGGVRTPGIVAGAGGGANLATGGGALGGLGIGTGSMAGTLGLGASALGLFGSYKLGQSNSKIGKSLAVPVGVASGLAGFGALTALFPALLATGPAGWIAAAGIGAGIGLIGLFKSKAEDKIVKEVRQLYGFDIDKKFARDSLLPIIKNQFGGDIAIGLRSGPVRELIELYAMSRGLNSSGIVSRAAPSVFASRGGSFQQMPTFQNGTPVLAGASSMASGQNITLQLDGPATTAVLQGQIASSSRIVSRSADRGQAQRGSRATGNTNFVLA